MPTRRDTQKAVTRWSEIKIEKNCLKKGNVCLSVCLSVCQIIVNYSISLHGCCSITFTVLVCGIAALSFLQCDNTFDIDNFGRFSRFVSR